MSKIGPNALVGGNFDAPRLLDWLDRARPPASVFMDNSDFVLVAQARYPAMLTVYRRWPDDSIPERYPDAAAWVRMMAAYVPDDRVALYAGNEPGPACRAEMLTPWTLAALAEADRLGRRLVVGNFGMGGPEDHEWRGALRPILQAIAGTWHVLGVHEYFDFHDWRAAGYDPLAGDNWLIGRYRRMFDACDEQSIPRPLTLVTEHGSDSLDARYHGWRAGDGLSAADYARQLMHMDALIYDAPEIIGTCVFCWDATGGNWETFNIKDAPELLDVLAEYAQETMDDEDEGEPMELTQSTVYVIEPVSRRYEPGLEAAKIGLSLLPGEYEMLASVDTVDEDGYTWRQFQRDGETWWSATGPVNDPTHWIQVIPVVVEPPEPPPPTEPPATVNEQWLALLTAWDGLTVDMINAMTSQVESLQAFRGVLVETIEEAGGEAAE